MLFKNYDKVFVKIFLNIMSVFCIFMLITFSGCGTENSKATI